MMAHEDLILEKKSSVWWVRLNRPGQLNSLNRSILNSFSEILDKFQNDTTIKCLVITGNGRAFCAGADLKEFQESGKKEDKDGQQFLDKLGFVFNKIRNCQKPIICGLNGITMAGGLELAMCCDIIFASDKAKIGDAHSNYGIFPGAGGTAVLPQRIGSHNAKYMLFSGNAFSAHRLYEMGLVQEVIEDKQLENRLSEFADLLSKKSALTLSAMKEMADLSINTPITSSLKIELELARRHSQSKDMQEGLKAFSEKRNPKFK
ncbi:MAG: enoyl-CoA hydratase [Rhodospirillaceae bacterium]|nr:enoyl-CoA hydratase [Rhodospirillaceae bacterium]|tara:strand:+ start:865 stop:1650 length:786 start_codon:yes stop_codon:yes gene_type:complete